MQVSSHEWEALYVCLATFTTLWTATYFCTAKACAPGHKLELMIAAAYCGTTLDDSLAVHAGRPLTAVSVRRGYTAGAAWWRCSTHWHPQPPMSAVWDHSLALAHLVPPSLPRPLHHQTHRQLSGLD